MYTLIYISITILVLLFSSPVWSAAYYVDFVAGADSNAGTSTGAALKRCPGDANYTPSGSAPTTLAAGDAVIFKGGVQYNGTITVSWSGTAGNLITYDGNSAGTWGTGKAIIDGENTRYYGFTGNNKNYVTLNGFEIRNMAPNWADSNATAGIIVTGGSTSISIINNYIHDIGYWANDGAGTVPNIVRGMAMYLVSPTSLVITGNEITKTGYAGIRMTGPVNGTISSNNIHHFVNWGIDISCDYATATGNIIDGNTIHDLYQYDCGPGGNPTFWPNDGTGACNADGSVRDDQLHPHSDFIFLRQGGGASPPAGNIIRNNLFYNDIEFTNTDGTAMIYASYSGGNKYYNNIFINPHSYYPVRLSTNDEFYNNIIYSPRVYGIFVAAEGLVSKNNIIICSQFCYYFYNTTAESGITSDYNLFFENGTFARKETPMTNYANLSDWDDPQDTHSTSAASIAAIGFADIAGYPTTSSTMDLTTSAAPALDGGVSLSSIFETDRMGASRPIGAAWDIGAYEYDAHAGSFLVTPSAVGAGCSVAPSISETVVEGANSTTYTRTLTTGWIGSWSGTCGATGSAETYQKTNVTADCTIVYTCIVQPRFPARIVTP